MGWVVNAMPRPLFPRERPDTHCIGGWVGGKFRPPPGFDPRTFQPVTTRYTDLSIQTHTISLEASNYFGGILCTKPK